MSHGILNLLCQLRPKNGGTSEQKKPSQASQIMTPQASSCDQTCARPFHKSERSDHATMELLLGGPAARPRN